MGGVLNMKRLYAYLIAALLGVALGTGIEHAYSDVTTTAAANPSAGAVTSGGTAITGSSAADTRVCFNDGGVLSCGDAGLTYNKTTDTLTVATDVFVGRDVRAGSSFYFASSSIIRAPADGQISLTNAAGNDFSRLQFGGTTSSFPALKRNGTIIEARLADDSNRANLAAEIYYVGGDSVSHIRESAGLRLDSGDPGRPITFFINGTQVASVTTGGALVSNAATAGIGYTNGAGGTVTQATSKSTAVTCSKVTCEITMNGEALAANTTVSFTLTNTAVAAADQLLCTHHSGGTIGAYTVTAFPGAGTATVALRNVTAGSLSEAVVLKCQIFKGATS